MAKIRLAGKKKKSTSPLPGGGIPCLVVLVLGFVLISLLFYAILKSG